MGVKYSPTMLEHATFVPIAIMVFGGAIIISGLASNGGGGLVAFAVFSERVPEFVEVKRWSPA
jgi:hypothetical protein